MLALTAASVRHAACLATEAEGLNLAIQNVLTIKPQRSFWDKIIILHGQRHWFQNRDELYKDGQRLSRHSYDVYLLLASEHGMSAMADLELAKSCADHPRPYFDRKPLDLDLATPGTFGIAPPEGMLGPLEEDYDKMDGMIFGEIPPFQDIIERIAEATLNNRPKSGNEKVGLGHPARSNTRIGRRRRSAPASRALLARA
ncbi:nucleotidyl transferase AbiEii/AbiGii toxin family protein [Bradyrhizobium sp. CCGUVB1N3]|uniref:nucleotidyl transferase AbiEii/AbiGii toxin family protein n=1 Tax=Bradyrhizobium sp. CCGUVB1N3 TaxID=2949629 RepID=UPI0020B255C0|nr:nucleotidyl transferase AbiEii/AbiGii toxin family protein [Bradyrhizobium sp. CCGUVB1N3]MCP3475574.1 nucleotidyl transferase AbiEii/AbiGii toxin family protein [Bradyrhizobium sp. CCGUVB1N3]